MNQQNYQYISNYNNDQNIFNLQENNANHYFFQPNITDEINQEMTDMMNIQYQPHLNSDENLQQVNENNNINMQFAKQYDQNEYYPELFDDSISIVSFNQQKEQNECFLLTNLLDEEPKFVNLQLCSENEKTPEYPICEEKWQQQYLRESYLAPMFSNILDGVQITDQDFQQLNNIEKSFIYFINQKKIGVPNQENNCKQLKKLIPAPPCEKHLKFQTKRIEEQQKLFFKKAFCYLENKFNINYKSNNIKVEKKKSKKSKKNWEKTLEFYNSYFQIVSERLLIDISSFFHPEKQYKANIHQENKKEVLNFKSFNQKYITLLLQSEKFKEDCREYLLNHFVPQMLDERYMKMLKLLTKANKVIISEQLFQRQSDQIDALRNFLLQNSKTKLPWSYSELICAQQFAKNIIDQSLYY